MQVDSIISMLVKRTGKSYYAMSAALGKSPEWARNSAAAGRAPKMGTIADVADVAGVDVVLIDRATGERVAVVDPPRRAGGAE